MMHDRQAHYNPQTRRNVGPYTQAGQRGVASVLFWAPQPSY